MSSFSDAVYKIASQIPAGKVMTYQQIAFLLSNPRSSRAVGNILHRNRFPELIPCHRVVNSRGGLAENYVFGGRMNQRKKLMAEGIRFGKDGRVDLKKYGVSTHWV